MFSFLRKKAATSKDTSAEITEQNNGDIEYFNKTAKLLIPKEPFTLRFYQYKTHRSNKQYFKQNFEQECN